MKRWVVVFMVLSVPLFISMNVWQSLRYDQMQNDLVVLEEQQRERLEEHRKLMVGAALLDSPERIDRLAEEYLGLQKAQPEDIVQISFPEEWE